MDKSKKLLIILLVLITVAALAIAAWALFFRNSGPALTPDYAPQETEGNAETLPGDDGNKLESPEGGGAVSLSYAKEVTIDLSDAVANLYFANPGRSNQDMVLQLVVQEQILLQSGKLTPGHQVTKLDLLDGAAKMLSPGIYEGKFVVLYYNQETGEKAVVNTDIPVKITVAE